VISVFPRSYKGWREHSRDAKCLKNSAGFSPDLSISFPNPASRSHRPSELRQIVEKDLLVQVLLAIQKYGYAERLTAIQ